MAKNYLAPNEILDYTTDAGVAKVNRTVLAIFLMAVMAGVYIALGALASSTAAHAIHDKGVAKLVTGAVFPIGLMFVVLNGADLFTGNCLIVLSTLEKRTRVIDFFKNLVIVLAGNFVGAVSIAFLQANTGLFRMSDGGFAAYALKTAITKSNLPFTEALCLAIICNIFVCAGIWMIYSAKDVTGKILAGFFSIFAFAISGAEHIVANMYYVPVGLFIKMNPELVEMSGVAADKLDTLTWGNFFVNNAIPVTIGNLIGGVFIGVMYYVIYKKCTKPAQ
ncbi:formate/nitrite transporter family protein [Niameybacter massiliensis]|uniref:Formate/nitrite transporter family protein n=1 Tax=Holtiella tumoricola TaxID=3018743 RepID=A0AA42DK91_9FIRM|nr:MULTISPECIES: formate/nitrite transporter family protein [Lachnospirales]MDA3730407.1 formate/nitrite transporter family protein [Holtiella tumoricola]